MRGNAYRGGAGRLKLSAPFLSGIQEKLGRIGHTPEGLELEAVGTFHSSLPLEERAALIQRGNQSQSENPEDMAEYRGVQGAKSGFNLGMAAVTPALFSVLTIPMFRKRMAANRELLNLPAGGTNIGKVIDYLVDQGERGAAWFLTPKAGSKLGLLSTPGAITTAGLTAAGGGYGALQGLREARQAGADAVEPQADVIERLRERDWNQAAAAAPWLRQGVPLEKTLINLNRLKGHAGSSSVANMLGVSEMLDAYEMAAMAGAG